MARDGLRSKYEHSRKSRWAVHQPPRSSPNNDTYNLGCSVSGSTQMTGRLAGKVCIITGAGSGIGRATAQLFNEHGASVIAADIDPTSPGVTHHLDVSDEGQSLALAKSVVAEYKRVDVLFNNAGIAGVGDLEETSLPLWEQVMRVNARGVFLMCRAVVPVMIAQRSGSIINMSSAIAETGLARRISYAASKGAVLALTRSMQVDLAPYGIRVNALLPGTIMTAFVENYLQISYDDPAQGLRSIRARQLCGDLGSPIDVAYAALYLASDESAFVLGASLAVDGGLTAGRA
jgi:NAD(P)-dependent dehydrogenase (short-subunit alcohol dehydrogenase family)